MLLLAYDELGVEEDRDLCKKIKNVRYRYVDPRDREKANNLFRLLVNKMENSDYDAAAEKERLLSLFQGV